MVNLAEWSVEAVRAGERATAYRESNRRRIERRSSAIARPVDQGNTVERIGEGPKRVLVNLAEFLDPDRKSTRLNSSHLVISYAVFCLKKKKKTIEIKQTSIIVSGGPEAS